MILLIYHLNVTVERSIHKKLMCVRSVRGLPKCLFLFKYQISYIYLLCSKCNSCFMENMHTHLEDLHMSLKKTLKVIAADESSAIISLGL